MILFRCDNCTGATVRVMAPALGACCPRCGLPMVEVKEPPPPAGPKADATVVSWETVRDYLLEAAPISIEHIRAGQARRTRPYVDALAHALTLHALCRQFGWQPKEILDLIVGLREPAPPTKA